MKVERIHTFSSLLEKAKSELTTRDLSGVPTKYLILILISLQKQLKEELRDASYRTTPLNPATALILQRDQVLENEKTGQILFEESLTGHVPFSGQLSNHFIEGMRKIYELEPFISIEKNPKNQWGGVAVGI